MTMSAMEGGDPNAASQFACDNCGGVLLYDPEARGLKCKHCKTAAAAQRLAPLATAREIPLAEGLSRAPKGLGIASQAIECGSCGATVQIAADERSTSCVYCASPMVVVKPPNPDQIQPESLIPFLITTNKATDGYKAWLSGLWFRPNDLSKMAKLEGIRGVYVPYWTFDAYVRSDWTAERGWHYQETETYTEYENGQSVTKTRTVTKTRWEYASGWRTDVYDDVLVCGSKGVPEDLADRLCTFNTQQLQGYNPGYLCGWRAESYAVDLPNAWVKGQGKIVASQEGRCAGDIGGDTYRGLSVRNQFSNETFKHILLPIFVAAYRYNDKPYQVLINGQTGEVVGKAPWSWWKIGALILLILAVIITIVLVTRKPAGANNTTSPPAKTAAPPAKTPPKK